MPNAPQIKKQLEEIGVPRMIRWTLGNELIVLAMAMGETEAVRAFVTGQYKDKKGVLAATDTRLIFASGNGLTSRFTEDFPYDKLSSIEQSGGLTSGTLVIHASGNSAKIEKAHPGLAQKMVQFVQGARSKPAVSAPAAPAAPVGGDDLAAQLEKLGQMKASGVLTEDEFAQAKKKLLGL
jgi:hypothetical protein